MEVGSVCSMSDEVMAGYWYSALSQDIESLFRYEEGVLITYHASREEAMADLEARARKYVSLLITQFLS